ncbi:hypothetical protein VEV11M_43780 (plasmid) [Escherichia coli]|nr:hypothetical protein VEV11M_43780 [Escherichia coli]
MCLQALTQLEDYIKKHKLANLSHADHIDKYYYFNAALFQFFTQISVYDAYHFSKPAPSQYDYRSMNMKQ